MLNVYFFFHMVVNGWQIHRIRLMDTFWKGLQCIYWMDPILIWKDIHHSLHLMHKSGAFPCIYDNKHHMNRALNKKTSNIGGTLTKSDKMHSNTYKITVKGFYPLYSSQTNILRAVWGVQIPHTTATLYLPLPAFIKHHGNHLRPIFKGFT